MKKTFTFNIYYLVAIFIAVMTVVNEFDLIQTFKDFDIFFILLLIFECIGLVIVSFIILKFSNKMKKNIRNRYNRVFKKMLANVVALSALTYLISIV